jgi:hypothetical protein
LCLDLDREAIPMRLVTRNVADVVRTGVPLINPFD